MINTKIKTLFVVSVALIMSACATVEDKLAESGATRLDGEQAKAHIADHTETWTKGAGYYAADGTLHVVWQGAKLEGPYTVSSDGNVCYKVADWDKECHFYMNDNGRIIMMYKGKDLGVKEIAAGNLLENFQ